jgi:Skp family chaperone for outer membrane proteins
LALIIAIVAVTALFVIGIWAIVKALSNQKSASEIAIDNMKKLTAEAYNFKKAASDFDSVVDAFDKVDSKIIKTADDMASLSSTAAKAKELLNNLNTSDSRNSGLLKSIFGTDDKDAIASMIESASTEQLAD